jgi:hypothetical protein
LLQSSKGGFNFFQRGAQRLGHILRGGDTRGLGDGFIDIQFNGCAEAHHKPSSFW